MKYVQRDGQVAANAYFCAEQNALVVRNAEEYYRNMFRREVSSWNLHDAHIDGITPQAGNPSKQPKAASRRSSFGRTIRTSATRARRKWASGENSISANWYHEHFGKEAVVDRIHHLRRHRHGGIRLGRPGRAQKCATGASRKLQSVVSQCRCSEFLSRLEKRC